VSTIVPAAPDRLELVRRYVNTWDVEAGTDALEAPAELGAWLRDAGLLDAGASVIASDVQRCMAVREALRSALAANHHGGQIPEDALAVLNDAADRADLVLGFSADADWSARPRAAGVDHALGTLLAVAAEAMAEGTWPRLKVCVNDACQWAFYDHSKARAGKWCSMQICGNRAKQQAWRSRHGHL
jgi:predicted RNA-binding Zn ribbon-like protein